MKIRFSNKSMGVVFMAVLLLFYNAVYSENIEDGKLW